MDLAISLLIPQRVSSSLVVIGPCLVLDVTLPIVYPKEPSFIPVEPLQSLRYRVSRSFDNEGGPKGIDTDAIREVASSVSE